MTNYLSKRFSIIEQNTKQLSLIPNDMKSRIHLVDQLKTYYVMVINKAIYSIANTIKKLNIQKNMHMTYKQDLYKTKEKEIYYLFLEYLVTVMEDIEHPTFIEEWTQNLDAAAHEKIYTKMKVTIN